VHCAYHGVHLVAIMEASAISSITQLRDMIGLGNKETLVVLDFVGPKNGPYQSKTENTAQGPNVLARLCSPGIVFKDLISFVAIAFGCTLS
jgi:hypothetical protein